MTSIDTIIVAGGKSSRLNNVNKLFLTLNGKSLLDIAIENSFGEIFFSNNSNMEFKDVKPIADLVPDGGPAAGVWACLNQVKAEYVFILAVDQPFIGPYLKELKSLATSNPNGAWLKVGNNYQPFASCLRTSLLKNVLAPSGGVNTSLHQVLGALDLAPLAVSRSRVWDIDTWADYFYALGQINEKVAMTDEWIELLSKQFELNLEFLDKGVILDLTREVAHNIERKAAPLTTFILGYLAGKGNLSKEQINTLIKQIERTIAEIQDQARGE